MREHRKWTDEERSEIVFLRDEKHMKFREIGLLFGVTENVIDSVYRNYKLKLTALWRERPSPIPNKVLIDRDRRDRARETMSLTARRFGDPEPGRSALDKRRAMA